jgi:hypothetical protein
MLKLVRNGNLDQLFARTVMFEAKLDVLFWTWDITSRENCYIHVFCDDTPVGKAFINLSDDAQLDEYALIKQIVLSAQNRIPDLRLAWAKRNQTPASIEHSFTAYTYAYHFLYKLTQEEADALLSK